MKIGIIACGWLGIRIAEFLQEENEIYVTTRSTTKEEIVYRKGLNPFAVNFRDDEIVEEFKPWEKIKDLDLVIITIPYSKRADIDSLKNRFTNLSLFINKFDKQIFLMSSIGIYPQINLEITEITETTLTASNLNRNILTIENFMRDKYPQINILRLGGLMGDDRVFSKYKVSSPNQIVNHVHYEDISRIIKRMIELELSGKTYNVVAPEHPRKQEIINFQKGTNEPIEEAFGRKIVSTKLETELNYSFIKPNPVEFDLE